MRKLYGYIMTAVLLISLLAFSFPADKINAAEKTTAVQITIGGSSFEGVFYDNDTAKALLKSMPAKFKMSELNGNEKYSYLKKDLPVNEKRVRKIKAGDIMLYGPDCLVVFYKSFTTSYQYTPIGRITNTAGLKKAVGKGSITIQFSAKKVIELSRKNLTLDPGQSKAIKLKGANAKQVRWSSSNSKVAAVSNGKIRAKKAGKTTITAVYENRKYKCSLIVRAAQKEAVQEGTVPKETVPEKIVSEETIQKYTETDLSMFIGDKKVNVQWEANESVAALRELVSERPLTIRMSMYGGFEQVGPIGTSLPSNDEQTTTGAGDIVLYSGNQIVVFYGSNSWSYTRLGHINDQDVTGMTELLGNGDVTITISMVSIPESDLPGSPA